MVCVWVEGGGARTNGRGCGGGVFVVDGAIGVPDGGGGGGGGADSPDQQANKPHTQPPAHRNQPNAHVNYVRILII